jgi:hypothetical protein
MVVHVMADRENAVSATGRLSAETSVIKGTEASLEAVAGFEAETERISVDLARRRSVATNAVAWELFSRDGKHSIESRRVHGITAEEKALAERVANRVIHHLDGFDQQIGMVRVAEEQLAQTPLEEIEEHTKWKGSTDSEGDEDGANA